MADAVIAYHYPTAVALVLESWEKDKIRDMIDTYPASFSVFLSVYPPFVSCFVGTNGTGNGE